MKILSLLLAILYYLIILLLSIDVYGSNIRLYKYAHINSYHVAIIGFVIFLGLRFIFNQKMSNSAQRINTHLIFPTTLILSTALTILDSVSPPNYVFSLTKLQNTQIFLIAVFSGLLFLINQTNKWFVDNKSSIIFSGAFVYLGLASIASMFPFEVFKKLSVEDNIIENLQVCVVLIGAYFALKNAYLFFRKKIKIHTFIFFLIFLSLLFLAGDEISWGQRLFQISTPETLSKYNAQNEITVHNLTSLKDSVSYGYMIIGFLGAFAWILLHIFPKLKTHSLRFYIPPLITSVYFLLGFLYNLFTSLFHGHNLGVWAESAELMLYAGIMFTLLRIKLL